jgi:DNA ligase-1
VPVEHIFLDNATKAEAFFNAQLEAGQEGIILRSPTAKYKHGRTTLRQDGMWKFKEFMTQDAVIVGIEQGEKMIDGIDRDVDAQGKLERTYKQENYTSSGMVGAFWVQQDGYPRFKVKPGKGHDNAWKTMVWKDYQLHPEKWHGKHLEYKFMPHGTMDKPRIGNLVRLRPDLD